MTNEFFEQLRTHSEAKIALYQDYIIKWLRKVNLGGLGQNGSFIIDGFSGQGIYEDGKKGSPIILIEEILKFNEQSEANNFIPSKINVFLIEKDQNNYLKLINSLEQLLVENTSKQTNSETLTTFQFEDYISLNIYIFNNSFNLILNNLLLKFESKKISLPPTLCFADPFGFSNTPFELYKKFFEQESTELIFNFMYEEINRFIRAEHSEKLKAVYLNLFGYNKEEMEYLKNLLTDETPTKRKDIIIQAYTQQILSKTAAQYFSAFEFKKMNTTKMFLFYITKHIKGLDAMKQSIWKLDPSGGFCFKSNSKPEQLDLFTVIPSDPNYKIEELKHMIYEKFKNTTVEYQDIHTFTIEETPFPTTGYLKKALKKLEIEDDKLIINIKPGNKRSRGTFSEKKIESIHFK